MNTFRRYCRHAYILHGYLLASLILMPVPVQQASADDPPETWDEPVPQSCLMAQLSTTSASGLTYNVGDSKDVVAMVERHTWMLQTSSLGNTVISAYAIAPVGNAWVTFSNGVSSISYETNAGGIASGNVAMGSGETTVVSANVSTNSYESTYSSLTFTRNVVEEAVWSWNRSEALITASLSVPGGGTTDLAVGDMRTVSVHVDYRSWDIFRDQWGHEETRNDYTSPASGANVTWAVADGSNGASFSGGSTQLDSAGDSYGAFYMGTSAATVTANIGYLNSTTANASVGFTAAVPVETWSFNHLDGYLNVALSANGPTSDVNVGDSRQIYADVGYTSWEVWTILQNITMKTPLA